MSNIRSEYTNSINFFGQTTPNDLIKEYGSPLYVYNEAILRQRCRELLQLSSLPNFFAIYSTKANTNLSLLTIIKEEGYLADAMSPGEITLTKKAGFTHEQIFYVCNNVSEEELRNAVNNNLLISVDSLSQLEKYGQINPNSSIMIRINPGQGAGHHKKVITAGKETKFGITPEDINTVKDILKKYNLTLKGINQHIGSLFLDSTPYLESIQYLLDFIAQHPDILQTLEVIDFGGGFGIPYRKYANEQRLHLESLGKKFHEKITAWAQQSGYAGAFYIEPGRYVVAECGLLLGSVHTVKHNHLTRYIGTDIGFNVLARPVLYDAYHEIEIYRKGGAKDSTLTEQTVVGNICESGDILANKRLLPLIHEGDIIGVLDAGAYGYVMASTYNQRLRPAEVLIQLDGTPKCIRKKETIEDVLAQFP